MLPNLLPLDSGLGDPQEIRAGDSVGDPVLQAGPEITALLSQILAEAATVRWKIHDCPFNGSFAQ
jgi:hypothetical protein